MGEEIGRTRFAPSDYENFSRRLVAETTALKQAHAAGSFNDGSFSWGYELEVWLLDHGFTPTPVNSDLLDALANDDVVPELSRFNVELNTPPRTFGGNTFGAAETDLADLWRRCNAVAHGLDANMVMIGTLPTIRDADLSLANISPLKRYYALNHAILRQRGNEPIRVDIEGDELLESRHADVMLEAASTSLQIHLKTPITRAHEYYNAAVAVAAPLVAAAANAPLLFDRLLWEETRIPLFEQSVNGYEERRGHSPRVTFGSGFLESSILELFDENLREFNVLLPILFDDPAARLHHLRLHNGTIWRWNRPLIGWEPDGSPHVRLEIRPLPGGPSIPDTIANCALVIGLVHGWVTEARPAPGPFSCARRNFYAAARNGLEVMLEVDGRPRAARDWLLQDLLPLAGRGLADLEVGRDDRERYLGVIEARVRTGRTGAHWQRTAYLASGRDPHAIMAAYCENLRGGLPVHEWPEFKAADQ